MKFLGIFIASLLLIVIGLSVFGSLLGGGGLLILAALLMALVVRLYMDLDERLERIEQHLGLESEKAKTLTEQLTDNETAP